VNTRRKILLAVAPAGLLLALALGLGAWLAYSEAGLERVVRLLGSLDSVHVAVAGERGRLAGPLHLDSLEIQAGRVTLHAEGVDLDHDLAGLVFGRLSVRELAVDSIDLVVGPRVGPAAETAPRFMPRWLSAAIERATVNSVLLHLPNGSELSYGDVVVSGELTHSRIVLDEVNVDAGWWTARGNVALVARDPLRLRGELAWTIPGEPELTGTLRAKGDLGRLEASAALSQPFPASADITLTDLTGKPAWQVRADVASLDLAAWVKQPPIGPLAGYLEASGDLQAFETSGHFDGPGLTPDGLDLEAKFGWKDGELTLQPLLIATPDRRLTLETTGQVKLAGERSLELRSVWSGLSWPLAGPVLGSSRRGTLDLRGWQTLQFGVDAALVVPEVPEVMVDASGQADIAGITVLRSALRIDGGRAEAVGYLGFDASRPWRVEARVRDLDLAAFRPGLDSRLSLNVAGSGQGLGAASAWAAQVGPLRGTFRGHATTGAGFVRQQHGRYDIQRFALSVGPARLDLSGHTGSDTALLANVDVPDLGGFLPELGGSLEATLKAHSVGTAAPGGSNLRVDLSLRGRDLRYGEQHAAVLSADADIDLGDREKSWIRLRAAGMQLGGQEIASTRISLDGLAREHAVDFRVGAGDRAVSLLGAGSFIKGVYRLTANRFESEDPQLHPYGLEAPMRITVGSSAAQLEETCFVYPPRRVCIAMDWTPAAGWSASLATRDFPLEALSVDLPRQPGYRGRLDLDLRAVGKPDAAWTANGTATLRDARLQYVTPSGRQEQVDLGTTQVRFESLPGRHQLSASIDDSSALQMRAEASLRRLSGTSLADSPLEASLQFSTTRLGLLPLIVPDIDRVEGKLEAKLTLSGTPGAPIAGGDLRLSDGLLDFYQTNLRLRETSAHIELLETGLKLEAGGKAGDGSFQSTGALEWRERRLRGRLQLAGERLLLADVPEVRIEASPDLVFTVDGPDITVQGSVEVPSARILPRQLVGAVTVSTDEHIVSAEAAETGTTLYRITTDLRLTLGDDVKLNAFGLDGRLEGSIAVQSRPDEVATASGELEVQDGKYRAYSKELDVTRGRLLFAGGPAADPGIDLRASKKLPGYEVGVIARGRLRRPELSLYSNPSMPQSQIASLLLVGRRLDNLDPADRKSLGGSTGGLATQGGAILAGQLGRYIGLDEVSVESGADSAAELVIGKFLSPRLYISYGISLSNAINTFKLRYTIGDRWVITTEAGQQASADILYTIDR
jgi:translocation and assembly module TamB